MIRRRDFLKSCAAGLFSSSASQAFAHAKQTGFTLPEELLPREIKLKTRLAPGEIHVDPNQFALFWTLPDNRAIRFAVGIGRGNLYHSGSYYVGAKRKWPRWKPTPAMMARNPGGYADFQEGGRYENGQPGGLANPLGARALYLYQPGRGDSYLRIHGTNRPRTIGTAVSNGCARLVNEHVTMLYDMVPMGTRVTLYPKANGVPSHS